MDIVSKNGAEWAPAGYEYGHKQFVYGGLEKSITPIKPYKVHCLQTETNVIVEAGDTMYIFRNRDGVLETYQPVTLIDLRATYPWQKLLFAVSLLNVLDSHYYDLGGIEQPGIQLQASVTLSL